MNRHQRTSEGEEEVAVVNGTITFTTNTAVQIDGDDVPFNKMTIATGSTLARPPIPGIDTRIASIGPER